MKHRFSKNNPPFSISQPHRYLKAIVARGDTSLEQHKVERGKFPFIIFRSGEKTEAERMRRRDLLRKMGWAGVAGLSGLIAKAANAKELRQRIKRVPISVGRSRKVKIDGEKAWHFILPPDKREDRTREVIGAGRQREERRDEISHAKGTVQYSIEFLVPTIEDSDGRLESKFIFFQIKPDGPRGKLDERFPYFSIQVDPNYSLFTDFEFTVGRQIGKQARASVKQNRWHRLDVVVKWSQGKDGFAYVEFDGSRISNYKGYTGPDGRPLVNFGIYRSHLDRANPDKLETLELFVRRYKAVQLEA